MDRDEGVSFGTGRENRVPPTGLNPPGKSAANGVVFDSYLNPGIPLVHIFSIS
jgi:hypothetical protein